MPFPERFLDDLINRCDITDVVSSYVQLTKRTGSNQFGLCPFHSEKTPSFSVSADKQIFHCFGCGKGGGVINFIMEIENLSFPDAVYFLAQRAGVSVPEDDTPLDMRNKVSRMIEMNREAAHFYHDMLSSEQGAGALEYIKSRGISKTMVTRFGLGVAPDSWTTLMDYMVRKGYSKQELLEAGLIKKSQKSTGGLYDTFRNRLMFPVIDVRNRVIGFSGRILDDGEPKYLNSSDTLVFNKSRNLFALNLAKKTKAGMIILTEGNIDVVALHQAGFDGAVASLGTSLTTEQARLLARYSDNIVIAYDSDAAGVKASNRAIDILEKTGVGVKVLRYDGAKDPDEYVKKFGADSFKLLLERSENHIEYRLLLLKNKFDLQIDEGRLGFLSEATEMLSGLESSIEREVYGTRVAEMANVSTEAVQYELKKAFKKRLARRKKQQDRDHLKPAISFQPADKSIRYDNVHSAAAEEGVIRLLLRDPTLIQDTETLSPADFSSQFLRKAFEMIVKRQQEGREISIASLTAELTPAEASQIIVIIQKPESIARGNAAMRDYIEKIKTETMIKRTDNDILAVYNKYKETKSNVKEDKNGYGG